VHVARIACLIAALATGSLVGPVSVGQASVDVSVEATDVAGSEQLVLRSAGTETNVVYVRYETPVYAITSTVSPLRAGPGCLITDLDAATCAGTIASAAIHGGDGVDVIDLTGVPVPVDGDGGPGDDALTGGVAANVLDGGEGADQLTGGEAGDSLTGGGEDDWIRGFGDSDSLFGGRGDDIIEGGAGDREVLSGGPGRDLLEGGAGYDLLQGDDGADVLFGGRGADTMTPGNGGDAVIGIGASDQLNCPTAVSDGQISVAPCAELESGRPPDSWPPQAQPPAPALPSAHGGSYAGPVTPGNATGVQVHVSAHRWKWVKRCLRLYSDVHRQVPLHPYRIRFKSRYWPVVRVPAPNPATRSARLTRSKRCRR
jgi:Ca2+-binding RTX toxin-like protein